MTLASRLEQLPPYNQQYLENFRRHKLLAGLSETAVKNYTENVYRYIKFYGKEKDLAETTRDDIENFVLHLKSVAAVSTQASVVLALRIFFTDMSGKEKAKELFGGIHIKVPPTRVRDDELLTTDEIKQMIDACYCERDRALISLLYSSGCRSGEIMGMRMKDVQFNQYGASIHVNGKTGERDVDIFVGVPELKAWINVHPHRDNPNAPVWIRINGGDTTRPFNKKSLWRVLQRAAERAGIPEYKRWHPHAFRHKRATDCAEIMTTADLKEMFGWSNSSDMPSVYVHSSRKRVAEKLMQQAGIKVPEQKIPTMMVKQCPNCGCINAATASICTYCSMPLEENRARGLKKLRGLLDEEIIGDMDEKERL